MTITTLEQAIKFMEDELDMIVEVVEDNKIMVDDELFDEAELIQESETLRSVMHSED